jgi:uncharacterized double-CXXCG motif protein
MNDKFFQFDASWANKNYIEAVHSVIVPGLLCPECGAWATTGLAFPNADIKNLLCDIRFKTPYPINIEAFHMLSEHLFKETGITQIVPGIELGCLSGKAKGVFGDFAWVNPWTVLLRHSILKQAQEAGLNLNGVCAKLDFENNIEEDFFELEVSPVATPNAFSNIPKCKICGRRKIAKDEQLVVDASMFDPSIPLQHIVEWPTILIVNTAFANFIKELALRDVKLIPCE